MGYIYGLVCPLIDKIKYIGQTRNDLNIRLNAHKYDKRHNPYKVNWIKKLKRLNLIDELKIILIEECDNNELNVKEKYWIKKYKDDDFKLVNLTEGGDYDYKVDDKVLKKKSNSMKGRFKGRIMSDETKKKISEKHKGKILSKDHKVSISNGLNKYYNINNKPKILDETKEKISIGLKNYFKEHPKNKKEPIIKIKKERKCSEEHKQKMRIRMGGINNSFYGKKHTQKTKILISTANKNNIGEKNPFYGKKHTQETRKILSDINKDKLRKKILMCNDNNEVIKEFTLKSDINNFLNVKCYFNVLRYYLNVNEKYRNYYWKK